MPRPADTGHVSQPGARGLRTEKPAHRQSPRTGLCQGSWLAGLSGVLVVDKRGKVGEYEGDSPCATPQVCRRRGRDEPRHTQGLGPG